MEKLIRWLKDRRERKIRKMIQKYLPGYHLHKDPGGRRVKDELSTNGLGHGYSDEPIVGGGDQPR